MGEKCRFGFLLLSFLTILNLAHSEIIRAIAEDGFCIYGSCQKNPKPPKDLPGNCVHVALPCLIPFGHVKFISCCQNDKRKSGIQRADLLESEIGQPDSSNDTEAFKILSTSRPAKPGDVPYHVSLYAYSLYTCGGAIYNDKFIITAAHCLQTSDPTDLYVVPGSQRLFMKDEPLPEQKIRVEKVIIHPNYDANTSENDIAILKLHHPLKFTDFVKPINFSCTGQPSQGIATVSGWGTTTEGGHISNILTVSHMDIVPDEECKKAYKSLKSSMICAGIRSPDNFDFCEGHSGAPIACHDDQENEYLCGITSFCGRIDYPIVFTETSYFADWVTYEISLHGK